MRRTLELLGKRRVIPMRQVEATECALVCVAMIAGYHGYRVSLADLRQRFAVSLRGSTVKDIIQWAASLRLGANAVRCDLEELKELRLPAILHWRMEHFVVLEAVQTDGLRVVDPALGTRTITWDEASRGFTGIAIELQPLANFQRRKSAKALSLSNIIRIQSFEFKLCAQVLAVTVAVNAFMLMTPLLSQLSIDLAIGQSDASLLIVMALGFGALRVFETLADAFRQVLSQSLSGVLGYRLQTGVFHHLLRLPLTYFQRRHVGDILTRFHAATAIKDILVNGTVTLALDATVLLVVSVLLLMYSTTIGVICLLSLALVILIRLAFLNVSKRLTGDLLEVKAQEQTNFIENIRGMSSIKATASEETREIQWLGLATHVTNADLRLGKVTIASNSLSNIVSGLSDILIIYLSCRGVMAAEWTLGSMMAVLAYKAIVTRHGLSAINNLIDIYLLDVHVARLADIVLHEREVKPSDIMTMDFSNTHHVEGRNLVYRYSPPDPVVVAGANLQVAKGEIVAINGESGCGKSTLLSIIAGLTRPSSGDLMVDGRLLPHGAIAAYRRGIGMVMQDDRLFSGSIADNIAAFDDNMSLDEVENAARAACVDEDIRRMPMGYRSFIGDMGAALSGGQRQRIMIARALYRKPWLLILDEGTAQIDLVREKVIFGAIRERGIACLLVTHRPHTLALADRIYGMAHGQLFEIPRQGLSPNRPVPGGGEPEESSAETSQISAPVLSCP